MSTRKTRSASSTNHSTPEPVETKKRGRAKKEENPVDQEDSTSEAVEKKSSKKVKKEPQIVQEPTSAQFEESSSVLASFNGKKFIVMGGFEVGKYKIESEISRLGGEVVNNVLKSLDYCVCGTAVQTDYGGVSGPGSKKYKECKKIKSCRMIDEAAFLNLVKQIDDNKDNDGNNRKESGEGIELVDVAAAEAAELLNEIISLLKVNKDELKGATDESITQLENDMQLSLPGYYKALLKISNGIYLGSFLFPSVDEIRELFFYNAYFPIIFRMNRWIPYEDLDCDFCWEVIDSRSGSILHFDLECGTYRQYGHSGTLLNRLELFRDFLKTLENPVEKIDHHQYREYEKAQGYSYVNMQSTFRQKFDYAYRKAERANK